MGPYTLLAVAALCGPGSPKKPALKCQQDLITCVEKKSIDAPCPKVGPCQPPDESDRLTECEMERK